RDRPKSHSFPTRRSSDLKKDYEIAAALSKAGAKNDKAVKALLDTEKVNFDDDGKLIGLSEQLEAVKKDNDFLFADANESNPKPRSEEHTSELQSRFDLVC